ncbi:alkaline phosphatase [Thalassotalea psychrophila]|uniref:Alkaline phosphatase n=1 Tax=Thalassotalea psychrophila TaxID=3065647 RepID=A0ABY9TPA9_9GAMM|nr:alkaline phosphatase [Colwelliaceae bacterium SQ149]
MNFKSISSLLFLGLSTLTLSACDFNNNVESNTQVQPKNIIMVVADGMGPAYPTAFRYYHDDPGTPLVERTIFDQILVGSASTYPASESGYISTSDASGAALASGVKKNNFFVTDSAASATALAAGIKTYNGAIGIDQQKQAHLTVLEWAKSIGKTTGIAVTSQIVHATPASYIAKNEKRGNYNAIADNYFDLKIDGKFKADVMLGGGTKYFIREDRNLKDEFVAAGYQYIDKFSQLSTLDSNKQVLGLFADVALPSALDSDNKNRLRTLTQTAIKQLENDNGFFLLVEASQVDWGGHSNDIAYAMGEMNDLSTTMEYLKDYVKHNPNTLVVLTADHNTGGFSIGSNGVYEWQPHFIQLLKKSPNKIANLLATNEITDQHLTELLGFTISEEEILQFNVIKLEQTLAARQQKLNANEAKIALTKRYYDAIKNIIDIRTHSGWTSGGHTGIDVPVYAIGQGKEQFYGFQDNIEIAEKLFKLMGKE